MATGAQRGGWYHGWNIVAVCMLSQVAANGLPINVFSLFVTSWAKDFHTSISTLQLGIGACGLVSALSAPFAGAVIDRFPARPLIALSLSVMAAMSLAMSFVTQPWQYVSLYAFALPLGIVFSTAMLTNSVISRWFVRRRGLALGLSAFGLGMGGIVMPPLIAAIMPVLGWRLIWRITAAIIAFVVLPLVVFVVRQRPAARDGTYYLAAADGSAPVMAHGHGGGAASGLTLGTLLSSRVFWLIVAAYLPLLGIYGGCMNNIGPLAASRGFAPQTAGLLVSIFSIAHLGATLTGGLLSDRFGNRLPLFGLSVAAMAGALLVAYAPNPATLSLGIVFCGFAGAFWPLVAAALATEFGAAGVGRAFGMVSFFLPFAVMTPFLVARTKEATGSYAPSFLGMAAVVAVTGLAVLLFMREKRGARAPAADSLDARLAVEAAAPLG